MLRVVEFIVNYPTKTALLSSVLKKAFEVKTDKELLLARCDYVKMLNTLKNLSDEKEIKATISDIQAVFAKSNLERPLKTLNISIAHISTLKAMYQIFVSSNEFSIFVDIKTLLTQLKEFDTDIAIKLIEILEEFDIEFKLIGNRAYEKLYIKLMGIIILYKDEIKNSSKNFKNIVNNLLNKVTFATKIIKTIKELSFESKNLIEIIGDYNG